MAIFKKQVFEDQILRIQLTQSNTANGVLIKGTPNYYKKPEKTGLTNVRVIITPDTKTDFELILLFDKKGKKVAGEKLLFRTETEIERKNWVSAINKLTQNLVEDMDKEGPEKFDLFNDN